MLKNESILLSRPEEIALQFFAYMDNHLNELLEGKAERMLELNEVADLLHIHPTHLSNTIKQVTGKSPCSFYEEKILNIAKELLRSSNSPIGEIAAKLTYDPSNFTKFFKAYEGKTPKQYRQQIRLLNQLKETSEMLTI